MLLFSFFVPLSELLPDEFFGLVQHCSHVLSVRLLSLDSLLLHLLFELAHHLFHHAFHVLLLLFFGLVLQLDQPFILRHFLHQLLVEFFLVVHQLCVLPSNFAAVFSQL